jgi:hypothetical protein
VQATWASVEEVVVETTAAGAVLLEVQLAGPLMEGAGLSRKSGGAAVLMLSQEQAARLIKELQAALAPERTTR